MLPDYIFIGPTKSGTTWIDAYLRNRDDVVMPSGVKEIMFFDKQYDKGLPWYEAHFKPSGDAKICVEVAPSLLAKPYAVKRLAQDLPNVEVICTLRNPIDRAVSHYFHYMRAGAEDVGFVKLCESNIGIILIGLYYKNMLNWINALGRERIHFMLYEDMIQDIDSFCGELCSTIQIPYLDPKSVVESKLNEAGVPRSRLAATAARQGADRLRRMGANRVVNAMKFAPLMRLIYGKKPSREKRQLIHAEAMQFYDTYRRDYEQLEDLIGIDLSIWKKPAIKTAAIPDTVRDAGLRTVSD